MTTSNALLPFGQTSEPTEAASAGFVNLCLFRVGADDMVLDIMRIREILRPMPVTPLPRAPHGVRGLINVRGTVIPLLDVRMRFGMPPDENDPRRRIMVVLDRRRLHGLLVDAVHEVARVPREALTPGTGIFGGGASDVFAGVVQHKGHMVLMLNLSRFLARDTPVAIPPVNQGGVP